MKEGKCLVCKVVTVSVALAAINSGMLAFFQRDLVARFIGIPGMTARIIYGVIGVAGLMKLISLFVCCPCCKNSSAECKK